MDNGEAIGMMAGAYFVGRGELLRWINDLTSLNYTKIEQTANGVFTCHVFDALFPGEVRFEKVNFNARKHYEFVHNYKVLQAAFNRLNLKKQIEVEKLIKGKYQDNLEFMQWVKAFYDSHASEDALQYDGRARREAVLAKTGATMRPALAAVNRPRPVRPATRPTAYGAAPRFAKARPAGVERAGRPAGPVVKKADFDRLQVENDGLKDEVDKLRQEATDNDTERAFYFNKLRNVELILQDLEEEFADTDIDENFARALDQIKNVLYAEDDVDPVPEEPHPDEQAYDDENADLLPEEAAHEEMMAGDDDI